MAAYKNISSTLSIQVDHRWNVEKFNRRLQRKAGDGRVPTSSLPFGVWADHFAYYLVSSARVGDDQNCAILQKDLDSWGVSFSQACSDTFEKLFAATSLDFASLIGAKNAYELHESTWSSGDHAARLPFPALAELPVPGESLIFPLSRNKMIIVGSESFAGLASVLNTILGIPRADALPPLALINNNNNLSVWQAPLNHPHHASLKRFADSYFSQIYAEQYNILLAECGCDHELFIAKFMLCEDRRKYLHSQAMVIEGVHATSLPKTDSLVFVKFAPENHQIDVIGAMSWEVMKAMMPDRLTKLDCYPERYLLEGFPSEEQLNKFCPESLFQFAVEYIPGLQADVGFGLSAGLPMPKMSLPPYPGLISPTATEEKMAAPKSLLPAARQPAPPQDFAQNGSESQLSFAPISENAAFSPVRPGRKFSPTDIEF